MSPNPEGGFVLYWMTSNRRLNDNFALDRALDWCRELNKPLLILEAVTCDYRWASVRMHQFILEGMRDNAIQAAAAGITFFPYVEPSSGHGSGLMMELAKHACVIIGDDFPCFFIPKMQKAVAKRVALLMEIVDSNGLLPMRIADQVFPTAYAFRRYLQKTLSPHLAAAPAVAPLKKLTIPVLSELPPEIQDRWPATDLESLRRPQDLLAALPIDQSVGTGIQEGGPVAGGRRLKHFVERQLKDYGEHRNHPDMNAASGLSAWLHFGHLSAHRIFAAVASVEGWTPANLGDVKSTRGSRAGWWGMSESAESFMDELITWRELGYNMCWQTENYDQYESLPEWARNSLAEHASDPRQYLYSLDDLRQARTHDAVWNAAQNQLLTEGRMQNYLRMLWGKKILEWTESPQQAAEFMIELNNRYAVDGRNPNSYSGIFWVLGRYDRAWGPERPIYGKIRYMTSDSTVRKLKMAGYMEKYSPTDS
ncbi:MAG: deoxyribodipyrimidine photolyase [Planctomycetaceae bacterium]|nr:deoxyribodipyrimidine photolyase [Planctomycetaceae bacterium]